ncbi:BACON domain-containing protein [Kitasatospora sp. NPDC054939]
MTTSADRSREAVRTAYDRQVDGLFTYCLSVLCEHGAATAALREVRELALRHGARLTEPGLVRAWLYSLARYCCLRRMAGGVDGPAGVDGPGWTDRDGVHGGGAGAADGPDASAEAGRRRRELASLAWPEAAGTDPEQREALELAVRHRLSPIEVAEVLGIPFDRARAVLAAAGAEVARTRAALLVLGVGSCPELDRLGGAGAESWRDWVLGPALRRELVQHVVDCPTCRGTAERVAGGAPGGGWAGVGSGGGAGGLGSWGGGGSDGGVLAGLSGLPVLPAPPEALAPGAAGAPGAGAFGGAGGGGAGPVAGGRGAGALNGAGAAQGVTAVDGVAYLPGAAPGRRLAGPAPVTEPGLRFDQRGFPRHRAPDDARGTVVRQRVVTTGVLAAVLAAPVVALWAGYQDGGGPTAAATVSSVRVDEDGRNGSPEQGRPAGAEPVGGTVAGTGTTTAGLALAGAGPSNAETFPGIQGPAVPVPAHGCTPLDSPALVALPAPPAGPDRAADGRPAQPVPGGLLTVEAGEYGNRTVLTLTNSGGTDITWQAVVDAPWLRLSRDSGTLLPGQRITVIVTVDEDRAPDAPWTARIALPPSHAVVTLEGGRQHPGGHPTPGTEPTPGGSATPAPTPPATSSPTAGPEPTASPTTDPPSPGTPSGSASPVPPTSSPTAPPTTAPTAGPSATPTTGPGTSSGGPNGGSGSTPAGTAG